ncbi:14841_t:CDS:1 [Acaulospora colombiana]|uniref:14841_t:CDS:1 n=1 Tax=Acaulospora colombiana TaxID=27376 RepID=A0ACA9P900_9GLOM|nr:14841_t:CDS:1 [Acaulospora colombiana]
MNACSWGQNFAKMTRRFYSPSQTTLGRYRLCASSRSKRNAIANFSSFATPNGHHLTCKKALKSRFIAFSTSSSALKNSSTSSSNVSSSADTSSSSKARYDALKAQHSGTESLLNTHMNRAAQSRATAGRPGSDGVFYLGIRPGDQELPKGYKKWKELGVGGKGSLFPSLGAEATG